MPFLASVADVIISALTGKSTVNILDKRGEGMEAGRMTNATVVNVKTGHCTVHTETTNNILKGLIHTRGKGEVVKDLERESTRESDTREREIKQWDREKTAHSQNGARRSLTWQRCHAQLTARGHLSDLTRGRSRLGDMSVLVIIRTRPCLATTSILRLRVNHG